MPNEKASTNQQDGDSLGKESRPSSPVSSSQGSSSSQHKTIAMVNIRGEGQYYSAEELMALELNSWKGWQCAASVENLYITADGNIFGAVCREGGYLGNIFETSIFLSTDYINCNKKWCMCGTDMALRKFRNPEHKHLAYDDPRFEVETLAGEAMACLPRNQSRVIAKQVTWEISRRCNYSCSYCPPSASNNYESHRSWGSLKHALQNIYRAFLKGDQCKFNFSGGEPTINPAFLDLLKWIKDHPPQNIADSRHYCHVTTNGSRQPEYYKELISFTHMVISVHFEFADSEKIVETAHAVIEAKKAHPELQEQWFGIRLMVPPGAGPRAESLRNRLVEIPDFESHAQLNFSPIIRFAANYEGHLADYDKAELSLFEAHA
ncbi:MAG: radical SAM protein [Bdellovibrionales bacterium]|nr:radical SAM protein [Bdellovibrionales bacterium]